MTPATAAKALLALGSTPFVAASALALLSPTVLQALPVRAALISYAGIILAFIGGLQQAAALAWGRPSATPIVVGGIALALVGWAATLASQFLSLDQPSAITLAVAYSLQAWLEQARLWRLPPTSRPMMLSDVRRVPMLLAAFALTLVALDDPRSRQVIASLVAAAAAARALSGGASRPHLFRIVAVGTTNQCKLGAVEWALSSHPEIASTSAVRACGGISSGVSEQPMGLEETTRGAKNRAQGEGVPRAAWRQDAAT